MVNSYVSTDKEPATVKSQWNWQKKDANKELLTNVKSLLEKVSNCEMAMACAKWMVTQLPSGKLSTHLTVNTQLASWYGVNCMQFISKMKTKN